MTATVPSRRERLRTATVTEIKETACRQLVAGGPTAVSLRAVARDMGVAPAALYRYFPSLDALLEELCADLYADLTATVAAARDAQPAARDQLAEAARAFRRWSIARPAEFTLLFGSPLPDATEFDASSRMHLAALEFSRTFLGSFLELWHQRPHTSPIDPQLAARVAAVACAPIGPPDETMPEGAYVLYLSGWTRLYGLVAMEIFGHLSWAVTDVEPLFEAELTDYLAVLAGGRDRGHGPGPG
jgi:AcrR family transcriptional regulator